jgi:hypothetical protein
MSIWETTGFAFFLVRDAVSGKIPIVDTTIADFG